MMTAFFGEEPHASMKWTASPQRREGCPVNTTHGDWYTAPSSPCMLGKCFSRPLFTNCEQQVVLIIVQQEHRSDLCYVIYIPYYGQKFGGSAKGLQIKKNSPILYHQWCNSGLGITAKFKATNISISLGLLGKQPNSKTVNISGYNMVVGNYSCFRLM